MDHILRSFMPLKFRSTPKNRK